MARILISSGSAFESAIGYSRAVVTGEWVFVSGCTGYVAPSFPHNPLRATPLKGLQLWLRDRPSRGRCRGAGRAVPRERAGSAHSGWRLARRRRARTLPIRRSCRLCPLLAGTTTLSRPRPSRRHYARRRPYGAGYEGRDWGHGAKGVRANARRRWQHINRVAAPNITV